MQKMLINSNGQILKPEDANVSVFDRGFLYGDSLYEVVRSYRGKFFCLEDHLDRLKRSADLCRMALDQSLEFYRQEILKTFDNFKSQPGCADRDASIRLIISRGEGRIGFSLKCLTTSTRFIIILQPIEPLPAELYETGMRLQVVQRLRNDPRALSPAMKSGNYLNSLLAYLEAEKEGYDDALLCNVDGFVTEGTTFNIFYVRRNILATPPRDIGILNGITRNRVLELAQGTGLETREVRFPKERLYEADEVFLTSSIREILPITCIDGVKIGTGRCGKITKNLLQLYRANTNL